MRRILEFESLRGLLAVWVVVGHVLHTYPADAQFMPWLAFVRANTIAVDVFIILSGFVIAHLLKSGHEGYWAFITRRVLRLFPVYAVCLGLSVATTGIALGALQALPFLAERNLTRIAILMESIEHAWAHGIAHLTMLHGALPRGVLLYSDYAFLGQAWSISVEWQFYLMAPFVLWAVLRGGWAGRIALAACVVILAAGGRKWFAQGFVGTHIHLFAVGIASYFLFDRRQACWMPAALAAAAGVLLLLAVSPYGILPALVIWTAVMATVIAGHRDGTGAGQKAGRAACALLRMPALLYLGRISYSVYLAHMIPLYLGLYMLTGSLIELWPHLTLLMFVTLLGTLLLSHVLNLSVEQPCIQLGKRLTPPSPAGLAGRPGLPLPAGRGTVREA